MIKQYITLTMVNFIVNYRYTEYVMSRVLILSNIAVTNNKSDCDIRGYIYSMYIVEQNLRQASFNSYPASYHPTGYASLSSVVRIMG